MNVEINLLPKKPVRKRIFIYLFSSLLIIFIIVFIFAFLYQQNLEREQEHLEQEIHTVRLLQEATRNQEQDSSSEEKRLDTIVELLESQRKPTTRLVSTLAEQLPERGFFTNFHYQQPSTVNVDVQFESQREAASYLHALNAHFLFEEVMINDVTTEDLFVPEDEDSADESVMPRYNASYTITINMSVFSNVDLWDELVEERENEQGEVQQ
ncbi:PilN domain-containing protein [Salipaludibacillus sp. HK11]|uniref:PilN domain-containing protein n=1 Tax=Salipaludibacillus sp. HK11 TaxID=3394320 RepID=UPI0039FC1818